MSHDSLCCHGSVKQKGYFMPIIEITDLSRPGLEIFNNLSEVNLLHYNEPDPGIFIAESPKVIERALGAGYAPLSLLAEKEHMGTPEWNVVEQVLHISDTVPVYVAPRVVLESMKGFSLTRGMLCSMARKAMPDFTEFAHCRRIAILEKVVNPTNLGAIFRSAAALNVDAVLLTPDCSDPLYRRAARVSMGNVFQIPWTILPKGLTEPSDQGSVLDRLRALGYKFVAMALKETSVDISDPAIKQEEKLAILLGNEGDGLCDATLDACDYTVMIPMTHGVDSLNVAAASAIAFWELASK